MRLLVAQDESAVASFLKKGLVAEHYAVDLARDVEEAVNLAVTYEYDLLILDLILQKGNGTEALKRVREKGRTMPILILTTRCAVEDRVQALDMGADDYLAKPFSFRELAARVRALLRRRSLWADVVVRVEDLEMNRAERSVRRGGKRILLTSKEFALLEYLLRNAGRPVTRAMLIEHVWSSSSDPMTNVIDVYITYLRKKVDVGFERKLIHTIRGVGYCVGESRD